ncbi:MAG: protein kinase [Sandaracinaceae bacterium]|nr:protein kinase [Sandaracinaceae bacterium]
MGDEDGDRGLATVVTPSSPELSPQSLEGELLAERYRILGVLGRGGMGTVYRVRDTALDEIVALKTLRRDWIGSPGALGRFRREVKLARRVTHPSVARTFDIGEHEGEPFLTMELIDGTSLAAELDGKRRISTSRVVAIAKAVTEGLAAAHDVGVVHRDLKPDNILLGRDGRVVITDFGIARVDTGDAHATAAGALVGTPAYMSPEQVQALAVDGRSDLYTLGLVLYEMLTGERPFEAGSLVALAAMRLIRPPPDPREKVASAPPELAELTLGLLAREPEARPTARQILDALARAADPARAAEPSRELPRPGPSAAPARTLAVFPLRTAGPPEDHWIGEGLTDDLFDSLCLVRELRMKARASVLPAEAPLDYARRLGVELVLEGSVRRVADQVRLVLRLTSVADAFQVWAERLECPLGELLAASDRAANAVAAAVGHSGPPREERRPIPPEALELYLRGREIEGRLAFNTAEHLPLVQQAYALAPDDPTIAAAYADALAYQVFEPDPAPDALTIARHAAERALELAPHLAEPWVGMARVRHNTNDTAGAARALRRALANGPSVAKAHDLAGRILTEIDRHDEARAFLERALALDPSLGFAVTDLIRIAAFAGDDERALSLLSGLVGEQSEFEVMAGTRLSLWLGRDVVETLPPGEGNEMDLMMGVTRAAVLDGRIPPDLRRAFEAVLAPRTELTRRSRLCFQILAELELRCGDEPAALAHVRQAVEVGLEDLAWLRRCPLLAPLHAAGALGRELAIVEARAAAIGAAWDAAIVPNTPTAA